MYRFEELKTYQQSLDFVGKIYSITNKWPKREVFGLADQFNRAAVSISLNIAEGTSRTKKDFRRFLDMARGSVFECVAILQIALRQKYVDKLTYEIIYGKTVELSKMISALKKSIS